MTFVPYDTMSPGRQKLFCCMPLSTFCYILGYTNMMLNVFLNAVLILSIYFIGSFIKPSNAYLISLLVVICFNVFWMIVNIICLLGLHNKKPVRMFVFVGVSCTRLFLSLALYSYMLRAAEFDAIAVIVLSTDIVVNACYVLVYYAYVVQLKMELEANAIEAPFEAPITFKTDDDNTFPNNKTEKTIYLLK